MRYQLRLAPLFILALAGATALPAAETPDLPDPGRTVLGATSVEIPFDATIRMPIVEARIDGKGPYRFVVDTGASMSVLDRAIAEELGLPVVGKQLIRSPGQSEEIWGRRVQAERIEIGDLTIEAPVLADMELMAFSGGLLQGVLGLYHFQDLLLTFDYPRSRLVVAEGRLELDEDPDTVAIEVLHGHVRVDLDLGGTSLPTHLDTGSPGGFTIPKAFESKLRFEKTPAPGQSIQLVGGEHPTWKATLDGSIRLAGLSYEKPEITLTTLAEDFGNIGYGVLRELAVTVDLAHGLARFERPGPSRVVRAAPSGKPRGRLGIRFAMTPSGFAFEDGGLRVQQVDPGGPADEAGLRIGDVVVSVNGKAVTEVGDTMAMAKLLGDRPLALQVRREGDPLSLEIQ